MSHVDKIDLKILDLEAARLAAKELGGELVRQSTYKWFGTFVGDAPLPEGFTLADLGKCEYAIKVPGTSWEIGLAKAKGQQHYTLLFDYYQSPYPSDGPQGALLEKFLGGREGNKFKRVYAAHAVQLDARRKGYMTTRQTLKGGVQQLTINIP